MKRKVVLASSLAAIVIGCWAWHAWPRPDRLWVAGYKAPLNVTSEEMHLTLFGDLEDPTAAPGLLWREGLEERDVKSLLRANGISFPTGSSVRFPFLESEQRKQGTPEVIPQLSGYWVVNEVRGAPKGRWFADMEMINTRENHQRLHDLLYRTYADSSAPGYSPFFGALPVPSGWRWTFHLRDRMYGIDEHSHCWFQEGRAVVIHSTDVYLGAHRLNPWGGRFSRQTYRGRSWPLFLGVALLPLIFFYILRRPLGRLFFQRYA